MISPNVFSVRRENFSLDPHNGKNKQYSIALRQKMAVNLDISSRLSGIAVIGVQAQVISRPMMTKHKSVLIVLQALMPMMTKQIVSLLNVPPGNSSWKLDAAGVVDTSRQTIPGLQSVWIVQRVQYRGVPKSHPC